VTAIGNGGPGIDVLAAAGAPVISSNNTIGPATTGGAGANIVANNSLASATLGAGSRFAILPASTTGSSATRSTTTSA
jgi:hypothetical protein